MRLDGAGSGSRVSRRALGGVLHIGVEKTGSTSLQGNPVQRIASSCGPAACLYPWRGALVSGTHVKAYAYASEGPIDELKSTWGLDNPAAVELFRGQVAAQFLAARRSGGRPAETICSPNEHLRLAPPGAIGD